ncbi:MAG: type III-A CRISPR-associated protein Cas10/Csm1 [Candidatus Schekmanbacteria bacterium]|nr:MAG: type III-A CRISPR-associated protein Cas10/Csm1 [Candidatus Schekmanbacteria bacterium]
MDENIYKIALAGLFHDIGKFAQRGGFNLDTEYFNNNAGLYLPSYNNNFTHYHALYTAAFIENIEKLLPPEFNSANWGLDDSFINLAAMHHKPETPLQWIVAVADRTSSGFERSEFEEYNKGILPKDYKKTRLLTIFESINLTKNERIMDRDNYKFNYKLSELSPTTIFPIEKKDISNEDASKEYEQLFKNFLFALEKLEHRHIYNLWLEHFDTLYMIFASHIPSATVGNVIPDISLYDHSRATSAIASALYLYHKENDSLTIEEIKKEDENKLLFIRTDFYGIQDFIFSEGGATNKASAKLLRGRSFAISLLSELTADMICRECGLTPLSTILKAAGKTTIIAPNTNKIKEAVERVNEKINDWLLKKYYGEASIGISYTSAKLDDLSTNKIDSLFERINNDSEEIKHNRFKIAQKGGVVSTYLSSFNNDLSKKLCPYCGKRPSDVEVENDKLLTLGNESGSACKICRDHIFIGTNLVKNDQIAIFRKDAEIKGECFKDPIFDFYQISFSVKGKLVEAAHKGDLLKYWNISNPQEEGISKNITVKFLNGYVPVYASEDLNDDRYFQGDKTEKKQEELINDIKENKPKTFHHIAMMAIDKESKKGTEALGVLKADIDKLGTILRDGLKNKNISRLATFSRQLDYFFSIYIPYRLSSHSNYKDIYTIFAGGDDLFLIGPWNTIIDFAYETRKAFDDYVCNNPDITISAGISVNKPSEPIRILAEFSEEALENSKNFVADNGKKKNAVTLFGETVSWETFGEILKIGDSLEEWIDKKIINNAMLFKYNYFSSMAKLEQELLEKKEDIYPEDWECLKWKSLFRYNFVRNAGKSFYGDEKERILKQLNKTAEWISNYTGAMRIPIWKTIYNRR